MLTGTPAGGPKMSISTSVLHHYTLPNGGHAYTPITVSTACPNQRLQLYPYWASNKSLDLRQVVRGSRDVLSSCSSIVGTVISEQSSMGGCLPDCQCLKEKESLLNKLHNSSSKEDDPDGIITLQSELLPPTLKSDKSNQLGPTKDNSGSLSRKESCSNSEKRLSDIDKNTDSLIYQSQPNSTEERPPPKPPRTYEESFEKAPLAEDEVKSSSFKDKKGKKSNKDKITQSHQAKHRESTV